jgi:hypothetical protein
MKIDITEMFCFIDDFCKFIKSELAKRALESGVKIRRPTRIPGLTESEIITIILLFHKSPIKNFKCFYKYYLPQYMSEFPKMPTYERFVILQQSVLPLLAAMLKCLFVRHDNIAFIDSTPLTVCHNKRRFKHKVCKYISSSGMSSKGWFYGLKLHVLIDRKGNLMNIKFTTGKDSDISVLEKIASFFKGILVGDRGYLSFPLLQKLLGKGVELVTGIRANMKNMLMRSYQKLLLKKRAIIETVFGYLKEVFMIEHHRHRSPANMFIHVISTLIAYQAKTKKPSISELTAIP